MTYEEATFAKYRGKRVLLDSNLLLLFMIGSYSIELIPKFKRTDRYTVEHYNVLVKLLGCFSGVVTTPHILTEVSSLANALPEGTKLPWTEYFGLQICNLDEIFRESRELKNESGFILFGLADSALQHIASTTLLLTEDRRLAGYLKSLKVDSLNFDDLFAVSKALRAY